MKKLVSAIALVASMTGTPGAAYLPEVHTVVSAEAFNHVDFDCRRRLGVDRDHLISSDSLRDLFGRGAYAEDFPPTRALFHFFDPIHGERLTVGRQPFCTPFPFALRADSWVLEDAPNSYSLRHAQNAYFEAVVGPNPGTRDVHLAKLFTTLGHVVHLIQDMAQPEHTRNDQHLPHSNSVLLNGTDAGLYEAWGVPNITGNAKAIPPVLPTIDIGGYPTVRLDSYRSYFTTPERDAEGRSQGRGIADFSNRGFVTQDTNYSDYRSLVDMPCFSYPDPREADVVGRVQTVTRSVRAPGDLFCCVEREVEEIIYTSHVVDYYTGTTEVDPFHSFVSAVDIETTKYDPDERFYSLSDESWQMRAAILIPRAVGYTAGLIERFFRGNVQAAWTNRTESNGVVRYDLTITNHAQERLGEDAEIAVVYRAEPSYFGNSNSDDTTRIVRSRIRDLIPFEGLEPNDAITLPQLIIPHLRPNDSITGFERAIAVRGTLGTQENEVIGLVERPAAANPGLNVTVTWQPATHHVCMNVHDLFSGAGIHHCSFHTASDEAQGEGRTPNLDLIRPSQPGGPMTIRLNPPVPGRRYVFGLQAGSTDVDLHVVVSVGGTVVRDAQIVVPRGQGFPGTVLFEYP